MAFLSLSSLASSLGSLSTSFRKSSTLKFSVESSESNVPMHLKLVRICLLAVLVVLLVTGTSRVPLRAALLPVRQPDHQQAHHHHRCWHGEEHVFGSQLQHEMLTSLCCWVTVGDSTIRVTANMYQFSSFSLAFYIDTQDNIVLMRLNWEVKSWCVRGKFGQVDVDRLKQVTQVLCGSSVSHYLKLRPALLPGYA